MAWRINWRVLGTGYEGHSRPVFETKEAAKAARINANKQYPGVDHWTEEVA